MAKATFSYPNKLKRPIFTGTVKRIAMMDIAIFFLLFLISNTFTVGITYNILINNLDERLENEIVTLANSFEIRNGSIVFTGYSEIKEPDFTTISPYSFFLQLYTNNGKLLLKSGNLKSFGPIPYKVPEFHSKYKFENILYKGHKFRVAYSPVYGADKKIDGYLQLAIFQSEYSKIINKIIIFNLFNMPFILLVIIGVSIFLAKKSYAPLNKIIDIAENISASRLNSRINYAAHPRDELGRLRDTLNNLFTRLELQINQIQQFTDNASHQLMTPLTAVKTELEYVLKKERDPSEYKESLLMLNIQTDKMISIIKSLLLIAKFSGDTEINKNIFKINQVVEYSLKSVFKDKNVEFNISDDLYVRGSNEGFQIIMENLIDNAVKYSPEDRTVIVKALQINNNTVIKVEDHGLGIDNNEKGKIFERFYRSGSAMQNDVHGYGLGLSVVKTIVQSMTGSITVEDNPPRGTKFIITFPSVKVE